MEREGKTVIDALAEQADEQANARAAPNTFKTVPSVYLAIVDGGKVLLSKRQNTGYEDGNYGLVSGHVEADETLRQAMAREAAEEVDLILAESDIKLTLVMHRYCAPSNPPERLDFFMQIDSWRGPMTNMEPLKCSELSWFELDNLPMNVIPYIKYALEQIGAGNAYCEYGWSERQLLRTNQ